MKLEATNRGFMKGTFEDRYGQLCSIQESSAMAEEGHIWLGMVNPELKHLQPGKGWQDINLRDIFPIGDILQSSRMHLSQSDVKELLPLLQYFAEHGNLPDEEESK